MKLAVSLFVSIALVFSPYEPSFKTAETYARVYAETYATAMVEYWFC